MNTIIIMSIYSTGGARREKSILHGGPNKTRFGGFCVTKKAAGIRENGLWVLHHAYASINRNFPKLIERDFPEENKVERVTFECKTTIRWNMHNVAGIDPISVDTVVKEVCESSTTSHQAGKRMPVCSK